MSAKPQINLRSSQSTTSAETIEETTMSTETVKKEEIDDWCSTTANVGGNPTEKSGIIGLTREFVRAPRRAVNTQLTTEVNENPTVNACVRPRVVKQVIAYNPDYLFVRRGENTTRKRKLEPTSPILKLQKKFHNRHSVVLKSLPFLREATYYKYPTLNELVRSAALPLQEQEVKKLAQEFARNFAKKCLNVDLSDLVSYTNGEPNIVIPSEGTVPPFRHCITFPWEPVQKDKRED